MSHLSSARSPSRAQKEQYTHHLPMHITSSVPPCCLLCSWQPRTSSGHADSKMKLDKLVPIYLILPESQSPGGEVCRLHTPATATSTKQQVSAEHLSHTHPLG